MRKRQSIKGRPPATDQSDEPGLRVLHAAAEAYPLIKTGGLADVAGALPPAQRSLGVDARLLIPGYPPVLEKLGLSGRESNAIQVGNVFGATGIKLLRTTVPENQLPVIVIYSPWFYERPGNPYLDANGLGWRDNHFRFALLGWVAAHIAQGNLLGDWQPDVLHAHDWHAALSMAYLNQHPVKTVRRIFTIHNLAYQGRFDLATGPRLMIDPDLLTPQHLEFHGELSFMKAGIDGADCITTVSPTYASEILTPAFGEGLDGMLRHHKTRLTGILNGVDADQWNPKSDTALWSTYDDKSFSQKVKNKTELRKQVGLANMESSRPLFGVVSRLTNQKGQDLILEAIPSLVMNNCQLVVLGAGDHGIEKAFRRYANLHPDNISFVQGYDETLAHQIFGGADSILVPSEFEPCGLTQLYGLRYGSVPIVRRVGGLADTVHDVLYNQPVASGMSAANIGNGFSFQKRSDFVPTLLRAIELYQESELWQELAVKGMREDHGWQHAANEYLRLYKATAI